MNGISALGIDWKLLLAQIINFLILLLILRYFLYRPVVDLLQRRRKTIEQGLKDAEEAQVKLDRANDESQKIIAKATDEADKIVKSAKETAKKEADEIVNSANERSQKIIAEAKVAAAREQEKVISGAKTQVARLVVAATEKILGKKTNGVEEAVKELE